MVSDHAADSAEAITMKDLLKMEKSPLVTLYGTGDREQLDTVEELIEYMNHYHLNANYHNSIKKAFSRQKVYCNVQ